MVDWDKDSSGGDSGIVSMSSNLARSVAFNDLSFNAELKNVGGVVGGVVGGGGPGIRGIVPMTPSLPAKNGPLSSSIGSIATTIVDQVSDDPEECGRVAGWVASFDKLLADPLGVHTLTVSFLMHKQRQGRGGRGCLKEEWGRELLLSAAYCIAVLCHACVYIFLKCVYVCIYTVCMCCYNCRVGGKTVENVMIKLNSTTGV